MNRGRLLAATISALQKNLADMSVDTASMKASMDAITMQLATMKQVVASISQEPEPDADGWIPRPTLR